ncbi:Kiwa anti-phage protein KwaB-like domain-containing protein [Pseudonocardia xishanensis]|uniref:DUF4868 domain-containing protein n=1 Tax=Pseudonocardia xishanensis TaxID=630995 RepID=A0ABP8RQC0_9PSEU
MTTAQSPESVLESLGREAFNLKQRQSYFVTQRPRGDAQIFRLTTTRELASSFDEKNARNALTFSGLTPLEYSSGRVLPEGHVMWALNESVPLLQSLPLEEQEGSELILGYESDEFHTRNLKLTVTTTQTSEPSNPTKATFFRITRPSAVLEERDGLAAWFNGSAFDRLDNDIVVFNDRVDAISVDGYTFFMNVHNFVRAFQFVDQMKQAARETFDLVLADLQFEDRESFRRVATTDLTMITKMTSIQRKMEAYPRYREALKMESLLEFVDKNPYIEIEFDGEGSDRKFRFSNNPRARFKILKLLDDDYLRSNLTEFDYEVDSKGAPSGA